MKSGGADALTRFGELEDRIQKIIEALGTSRAEKATIERELDDARVRIRQLQSEVESMRAERLKVRNRVERLISSISTLEDRKKKVV
jgi:chromosome segregation ATPase